MYEKRPVVTVLDFKPAYILFPPGNCTWGMNCRFIHPGVNDKGNYSLISKPDLFSPNGAPPGGPHPLIPNNPWVRIPPTTLRCYSTDM